MAVRALAGQHTLAAARCARPGTPIRDTCGTKEMINPVESTYTASLWSRAARDSNSGHRLRLTPPADLVPRVLGSRTAQGSIRRPRRSSSGRRSAAGTRTSLRSASAVRSPPLIWFRPHAAATPLLWFGRMRSRARA